MADIGKDILRAKKLLEQGELVAIPTETVYGLAGNALDTAAVTKIFEVKNRPQFDPLIVHVQDLAQTTQWVESLPERALQLAEKFWPGPLTLLLKKKPVIPYLVTSGMDMVGIRCPAHSLTQELLNNLAFPLAAPSANPFGYVSPTRPEHVNEQLGDKIAYILDGGICDVGIESTVVGFENDITTVYRMGGLSIEDIEKTAGPVDIKAHSTSNPKAPGQLQSHYAPVKKVLLGDIRSLLNNADPNRTGILSFQTDFHAPHQFILSESGNLREAAQRLFSGLRSLDKMPVDIIVAEMVPEHGLGKAINDRLRRAAVR